MLTFSKQQSESRNFVIDFSQDFVGAETLLSLSYASFTPADTQLLVSVSINPVNTNQAILAVSGGTLATSYTATFTAISTLAQVINYSVELVNDDSVQYPTTSDLSVSDLVGELQAGDSAMATTNFVVPNSLSLAGATVSWVVMDNTGIQYASGVGSFNSSALLNGNTLITSQSVITTPSSIPASTSTLQYQLRWTLTLAGSLPIYQYETIKVVSPISIEYGIETVVELIGNDAQVSIVLPQAYDTVTCQLYTPTNIQLLVVPLQIKQSETAIANGFLYTANIPLTTGMTTPIVTSLNPLLVNFSYSNSNGGPMNREFGKLFVVNPTIMNMMSDLRMFINKVNTTIHGTPDMLFTDALLIAFLRMGKDYFNMLYYFTNFDMIQASGGIKDGWLTCSSIRALRSHFIAEGEKTFDYQGQAISLTADRTSYYDSLASNLEGQLEQLKQFKQQLTKRGITGTNSDLDNMSATFGNIAAVGLNLTQISGYGISGYRRRMPLW